MNTLIPTLADIRNPAFTAALQHKIDNKTKPLGSLGRIEALALQLGEILGTESPVWSIRKWWCLRATTAWPRAAFRPFPAT
jgi:NaMN:DMB phosphoribosyltransferase